LSLGTPSTARRSAALGLILVLLLALAGTGVLLYRSSHLTDAPYSLTNSGTPVLKDSDRESAIAVAQQFALRVDTLDTANLDAYVKSVSQVLTTKFKAKFLSGVQDQLGANGSASSPGEKTTGKIRAIGVEDIDADSASILVAHDQNFTVNAKSVAQGFRWVVTLRKIDGDWLVDNSVDIDGSDS
jgi:hypothetical protein